MLKRIINIVLCSWAVTAVAAQNLVYEAWTDADYDQRIVGSGSADELSFSMPTDGMAEGIHFLGVRAKESGKPWGPLNRYTFLVSRPTGTADVRQYEGWIDADYSQRTVTPHAGGDIVQSIGVGNLTEGIHYYSLRVQDTNGQWGPLNRYTFLVSRPTGTADVRQYEGWIDADYSQRTVTPHAGGDIVQTINIGELSAGIHYYNIRAQDTNGQWGPLNRYVFLVPEKSVVVKLKAVEYWLDSDSLNTTVVETADSVVVLNIDISQLSAGTHALHCRLQNSTGFWGEEYSYGFELEELSGIRSIYGDDANETVSIYTLSGVQVKRGRRADVWKDLPRGIYIVNGHKVIVR